MKKKLTFDFDTFTTTDGNGLPTLEWTDLLSSCLQTFIIIL